MANRSWNHTWNSCWRNRNEPGICRIFFFEFDYVMNFCFVKTLNEKRDALMGFASRLSPLPPGHPCQSDNN
jgi:hypothetical protein